MPGFLTVTLARSDAPPALPRPPLVEHLLLEQPWAAALALGLGGLLAAWILNQRARARAGLALGAAMLLAGATIAVIGALVTTTREALIARTRELIALTARADTRALDGLLAGDVTFRLFTTDRRYIREELLGLVRRYPGELYPVESYREEQAAASLDGPNAARTQVRVVTRSAAATLYDLPVGSWWRIAWRREPDGAWRVTQIECLRIDGVPEGTRHAP